MGDARGGNALGSAESASRADEEEEEEGDADLVAAAMRRAGKFDRAIVLEQSSGGCVGVQYNQMNTYTA
jgi:hypothetical protein